MDPVLIVAIIAGVFAAAWATVRLWGGTRTKPPKVLGVGWQLYPRQTTLEPSGTVFRVDEEGRRYIVRKLELVPEVGPETQGRHRELRQAQMGMVARMLGLGGVDVSARKSETLIFELDQPSREYVGRQGAGSGARVAADRTAASQSLFHHTGVAVGTRDHL